VMYCARRVVLLCCPTLAVAGGNSCNRVKGAKVEGAENVAVVASTVLVGGSGDVAVTAVVSR